MTRVRSRDGSALGSIESSRRPEAPMTGGPQIIGSSEIAPGSSFRRAA
jgi:hypothetical protein